MPKVGVDDFLAAGGTVKDLLDLATDVVVAEKGHSSNDRPIIITSGRHMRDVSEEARHLLRPQDGAGPKFFRRGETLVELVIERGSEQVRILTLDVLRGRLARMADFMRYDQSGKMRPTLPPAPIVKDILAIADPGVPELKMVADHPVVALGGNLITTEGYHSGSGIYLRRGVGLAGQKRMGPGEAIDLIFNELLADFPFADIPSRAHALALMVEPIVRPLIAGTTPLHLVHATVPGTGKGLLVEVISTVVTGAPPVLMGPPRDDVELDKRLTAALLIGQPFIHFDNVASLRSGTLAAVLTTPWWQGRRLGVSEMVSVPNDATFTATGNNVEVSDELKRRVVIIRLDPEEEKPERRQGFRHLLPEWAAANRARLLNALVSLVSAWLAAGMPSGKATLGRYESWARIVGGVLDVAGMPGLLGNRDWLDSAADHVTSEWNAVVKAWWDRFGESPIRAGELLLLVSDYGLLVDIRAGRFIIGAEHERFSACFSTYRGPVDGSADHWGSRLRSNRRVAIDTGPFGSTDRGIRLSDTG